MAGLADAGLDVSATVVLVAARPHWNRSADSSNRGDHRVELAVARGDGWRRRRVYFLSASRGDSPRWPAVRREARGRVEARSRRWRFCGVFFF